MTLFPNHNPHLHFHFHFHFPRMDQERVYTYKLSNLLHRTEENEYTHCLQHHCPSYIPVVLQVVAIQLLHAMIPGSPERKRGNENIKYIMI